MGSVGGCPKEAKQFVNDYLVCENVRVGQHKREDVSVGLNTALSCARSPLGDVVFDYVPNGQTIFLNHLSLTRYLENSVDVRVKPVYGTLQIFIEAVTDLVNDDANSMLECAGPKDVSVSFFDLEINLFVTPIFSKAHMEDVPSQYLSEFDRHINHASTIRINDFSPLLKDFVCSVFE